VVGLGEGMVEKRLKVPPLKPFYRSFFFCSRCGKWVAREEAIGGREPLCPFCRSPLRSKPRNNRCRRKYAWSGEWLPGCYGFFGQPVEPWLCETCPASESCRGEAL